jgi:molybdate transport system permease protein
MSPRAYHLPPAPPAAIRIGRERSHRARAGGRDQVLTADEWAIVLLSLQVACGSLAVLLVPGIAMGWLLARVPFPGRSVVDTLVHLPLVLPPVVTGYLLLLTFGRRGWLGGWLHERLGVDIAFTWKGAVIAAAAMAFPLLVRAVRLAIELGDRRLEDAARTLGAGPWRVLATITLPLALPGIIAGLVLAFARSLGEFGATITLAGNIPGESRTLPVAIYGATQTPDGDQAATRLVVVSLAVSLVALFASEWLQRRWAPGGRERVAS